MANKIVSCPHCNTRNRTGHRPGRQPVCGKCRHPLPWLVDAADDTFASELEVPVPVLVDFWAAWCGPCRAVAPVLEALARDLAGKLKVVKLDTDANPRTASSFGVQSLPTLILFRDGEPVETMIGAQPKSALLQRLRPHL
jgi:thioredoxin 2